MKTRVVLTLAAVALSASVAFADVTVTPKKQTYRRPKPISSYKKTFTVTWPKVKGTTPAIARKIEMALSYEKAFQFTIAEEIREIQWLENATYEVFFNKGNILCVALSIEGSGAYPDGSTKYVVVDTRNGKKQTADMMFRHLGVLAAMVSEGKMNAEVQASIKEIRKDPELRDPDPSTLFEDKKFTADDLNNFSVNKKGVTFHYDYGFPHVIQAVQPSGEFFYTWNEIKTYLNPSGLLVDMAY